MQRIRSKLSSKNQITVPASVRNALGITSHDQIVFVIDDGIVRVEPGRELSLEELEGILPVLGRPTSPDFSVEIREAMEERAQQVIERMGGR
jgi:AbrB family looped-hinge helix DNA binding protein